MNKRLVALIVAVAVVGFILLLNFGFKKHDADRGDLCKQFVTGIQKGDAQGTYAMLTTRAQGFSSSANWAQQVKGLEGSYTDGVITFVSTRDATPVGVDDPQTRYVYNIKSGNFNYTATCFVIGDQIDGFNSASKTP